ncbi:MAG: 50S ribosomal protein L4 [Candidatus Doudnabacteria bacterium RIFCSPHIGHO2_01_FULL_43_23]|uniref:Large ribosomal subunit protein uL4 n=1 Tax=Candidatus Doudnabacteria bacterium RIFCSPHIGHO2_01_FULL_43_23 TaxID=1817822 RepID=A0A1F5NWE5_9BACT|nr:ribosomal protein L4 [uncultured bacterium]OGE81650.1 MAG: 50S ribosomal protein L4 [Candidatus Doudnabacteria bacterium RIFCSPHIGHO2_01_FULL_43_23]
MPKTPVYNIAGEKVSDIDLSENLFAMKPVPTLIHQMVVADQANRRSAIAHTKTRGNVRGGGRKPWKQKGTGRARVGSIRSPLWRGGGIIFGPSKEKNFSKKVNTIQFRKSLYMVLSDQLSSKALFILSDLPVGEIKSKKLEKDIEAFAKKLNISGKINVIISKPDKNIERSARNLDRIDVLKVSEITPYKLLSKKFTLIVKDALPVIEKTYNLKKSAKTTVSTK